MQNDGGSRTVGRPESRTDEISDGNIHFSHKKVNNGSQQHT
jgi:hypothetical protein